MKYVKWFKELSTGDISEAGGKGANLGELTQAGVPVPPGFVVLASAYFAFLEANALRPDIHRLLSQIDVNDSAALNAAASQVHSSSPHRIPPALPVQSLLGLSLWPR